MFKNILILVTITFLLNNSTVRPQENSLNISVSHSNIYAWLNLMPGIGAPLFNMVGNVKIRNNEEFEIKEIELIEVILIQNKQSIFHFEPFLMPTNEKDTSKALQLNEEKEFLFGAEEGIKISPAFDAEQTLTGTLIFNYDEKRFEYIISGIKIEKTY